MDVASWLRNLGLERYEATFRENGVSAEVLCHLTAEDLKELGVAGVGHRRQLVVAIAAGATAVIQPGGSIRDAEVIAAADAAGVAMVFTGMRHFRH